jgi:predicted N-formylglutamate amidohydrolase
VSSGREAYAAQATHNASWPGMMDPDTSAQTASLLGPNEPPAVETVNAGGAGNAVLVCDHASHRVPERLGSLGLERVLLADHIGWDPGAAAVARRLAAHLDAPLVLSGYSRLVIDCNRALHNAESIVECSCGIPIPGNQGLLSEETTARIDALFRPYHAAIARLLDSRSHRPTHLLSIHSFTPILSGQLRPWHIGVSYWRDRRLAAPLRGALSRTGGFAIGDNEPYPIEDEIDYTIPLHGEGRGLPCAMIEVRQDEIRTAARAAAWAARLAEAYQVIEVEVLGLMGSSGTAE